MKPECEIHMVIGACSEEKLFKVRVSSLLAEVGRLQQIIAELLQKNQELREALADGKVAT
jgi:hypothetical protein